MLKSEVPEYSEKVPWSHEVSLYGETKDFRNLEHPHILLPGLYLQQGWFHNYSNWDRAPTAYTWAWLSYPVDTKNDDLEEIKVQNVSGTNGEAFQSWLAWCIETFGDWEVRWDEAKKILHSKLEVDA